MRHDGCSQASPSKTGRSAAVPSAVSLTAAFPEIARAVPPEDRQDAEHTLIAPVLAARDEDLANVFATVAHDVFDFLNIDGVVL